MESELLYSLFPTLNQVLSAEIKLQKPFMRTRFIRVESFLCLKCPTLINTHSLLVNHHQFPHLLLNILHHLLQFMINSPLCFVDLIMYLLELISDLFLKRTCLCIQGFRKGLSSAFAGQLIEHSCFFVEDLQQSFIDLFVPLLDLIQTDDFMASMLSEKCTFRAQSLIIPQTNQLYLFVMKQTQLIFNFSIFGTLLHNTSTLGTMLLLHTMTLLAIDGSSQCFIIIILMLQMIDLQHIERLILHRMDRPSASIILLGFQKVYKCFVDRHHADLLKHDL